jgi:radical SAM superfamily enzyme with C-terminal helix-hairpin-helix motif
MITILDGYVDEPSCLGVPPYISPYPRYLAGAIKQAGEDFLYLTIDEYRQKGTKLKFLERSKILAVIAGVAVPGKYLRAMPASLKELNEISKSFEGLKFVCGSAAKFYYNKLQNFDFIAKKDLDAAIYDFLTTNKFSDRYRTIEEWESWCLKGCEIVKEHADFPTPLIAEIETYRGCVRYFTKGCSFCIEPLFGMPLFRSTESIIKEIELLNKIGVVNFRLGAQTCFYSYLAKGIGESETPKPNVEAIRKLLAGIRANTNLKVLHIDNVNPAVVAENLEESREITKLIVKYCTPGNVAALGMESADYEVIKRNNLNATPEQVMKTVELLNEYGAKRGYNGMPCFLPGINFVFGLDGETKETYEKAYEFLKSVLDKNLLIRRINIRQVLPIRRKFEKIRKYHYEFIYWKEKIRNEIDKEMMKRVVPYGAVLKEVFTEKILGNCTYARQIGTYPLLVVLCYKTEENKFIDIAVVDHGARSVTGIEYPLNINKASFSALKALPEISKKRAARIIRERPFANEQEFIKCLDEEAVGKKILPLIRFEN